MGNSLCLNSPPPNEGFKSTMPSAPFQQLTLWIDQKKQSNVTLTQIIRLSQSKSQQKQMRKYAIKEQFNIGFSVENQIRCIQKLERQKTSQFASQNINWLFLKRKHKNIIVIDSNLGEQNNLVVQILPKNQWYQLKQNNKFKIGKSIFRFIESGDYQSFKDQKSSKVRNSRIMQTISSKLRMTRKQQCKICFQDVQTEQNPLISPCKCSGSIQNIHIQCLNRYIFQFKQMGDNIIEIKSKNVLCNICNQQFSEENQFYDQIISNLLDNPNNKYHISDKSQHIAVLQAILENKKLDHKRTFYIIPFKENQILQFGRNSHFSDLKSDTLISRKNTSLRFQGSVVKIRDESSVNGTGVLLKFPYEFQHTTGKMFRAANKIFLISGKTLPVIQ